MNDGVPAAPAAEPAAAPAAEPAAPPSAPRTKSGALDFPADPPAADRTPEQFPPSLGDRQPDGSKGEDKPSGDSKPAAAKPKATPPPDSTATAEALKARVLGRDFEGSQEDLLGMLSDDFEHEFTGPGGEPVKLNWAGVGRAVQMSHGALARMQQAKELQKQLEQQRVWAQENPDNMAAYLETHLGVEDHEAWVIDRAKALYQRDQELEQMHQNAPSEYHRRMKELAQARFERKQAWEKRQAEQQQAAKDRAAQTAEVRREVEGALKELGLPLSDTVLAHAGRIFREYRDADFQIEWPQLAQLTRDAHRKELRGSIGGLGDDELLSVLGDGLRERLRKLEADAARGARNEARREQRAEQSQETPAQGKKKKWISDKEYKDAFPVRGIGSGGV
jgi:hypothetical protein